MLEKHLDVQRDINIWFPKVVSGGIISGHDADYPQVKKVLQELLPNYQIAPYTTIWTYQK